MHPEVVGLTGWHCHKNRGTFEDSLNFSDLGTKVITGDNHIFSTRQSLEVSTHLLRYDDDDDD